MASPRSPSQLASIATASAGCPMVAAPAAVATVEPSTSRRSPISAEVEAGGSTSVGPSTMRAADVLSATTSAAVKEKSA